MINGKDTPRPSIYTASPYKHGGMWKELRDTKYPNFTATWVEVYPEDEGDESLNFIDIWRSNRFDVEDSDAVIFYGEASDLVEGGLVEVGLAIAAGVPVFIVKTDRSWRSWTNLSGIHMVDSIDEAVDIIKDAYKHVRN